MRHYDLDGALAARRSGAGRDRLFDLWQVSHPEGRADPQEDVPLEPAATAPARAAPQAPRRPDEIPPGYRRAQAGDVAPLLGAGSRAEGRSARAMIECATLESEAEFFARFAREAIATLRPRPRLTRLRRPGPN